MHFWSLLISIIVQRHKVYEHTTVLYDSFQNLICITSSRFEWSVTSSGMDGFTMDVALVSESMLPLASYLSELFRQETSSSTVMCQPMPPPCPYLLWLLQRWHTHIWSLNIQCHVLFLCNKHPTKASILRYPHILKKSSNPYVTICTSSQEAFNACCSIWVLYSVTDWLAKSILICYVMSVYISMLGV